NTFSLGLSTSFEVDLWGRLRRAERSVREQLAASVYGRDTVALTLAATITRTYFAARSLDSQLAASEEILRAANESLALAKKRSDAGVARAAQFPTLKLTGSLGMQSTELDSLLSAGSHVWSIGASLVGPILDGGRYRARTEQAEAQARQAEASYQRAVETAFREVADALSNPRLAADSEGALASRLDQARSAL